MERKAINKRFVVLIALAVMLCIFCAVAHLLMPHDPNYSDLSLAKQALNSEYPFGTDALGRCVYSRVLSGAATSVFSALLVVGASALTGCFIGIVSGYFGGVLDSLLMRLVDIFLAFPGMVLALAVAGMLGKGWLNAVIALVASGWPQYARLSRSCMLTLRQENYIHAARLNGQSAPGILLKHMLPGVLRPVVVNASLHIGVALLEMAGLSFLGLGTQLPAAEWGSMLADGRGLMQQAPWLVVYPAIAICVTTILFNLLGDSVRDALDPLDENNIFRRRSLIPRQLGKKLQNMR